MNADLRPARKPAQRALREDDRRGADAASISGDDAAAKTEFAMMESAYARHGGMLCCDEAVRCMRDHWDQPISVLAKWIVARAMVTIDWRYDVFVPMFQIDTRLRCLRPGCREIIAELRDVMDDWDIARWFASGNPWLGGLPPVDILAASWREAFHAARVARFIARG